jgi:hypothetical protein
MLREASLIGLMRATLTSPRETASQLLGLRLPRQVLLEAGALLAVINGLLAAMTGGVVLPLQDGSQVVIGAIPWTMVLVAGMILSASALQVAGRLLGGTGSFEDSLLVTVWINVMALAIEALTVLLGFVSVALASILFLGGLLILLWSLVNFVRVLHGFNGFFRSILAILIAGFGTLIGLSFLLTLVLSFGVPTDV